MDAATPQNQHGADTDVKAMQAELRDLRARVRTLEAEKRRPTLEGHGARVQAIAAEAAALQPLKEAAAATAPASAAALALGPSVRLEYSRDSPMFRRQCEGFESSLQGLDSLLGGLALRLRDWSTALQASSDGAKACAAWLKDKKHGRALFGGNEALGNSSQRCATLADALESYALKQAELADAFSNEIASSLDAFREEELGDAEGFIGDVWQLGDAYEQKLCAALCLDEKRLDGDMKTDLADARGAFERSRLALVRYLNSVDASKCIVIGEAVAAAGEAFSKERSSGGEAAWRLDAEASLCRQALPVAARRRRIDGELWDRVGERLEGELRDELPTGPVRTSSAPTWSAALTTEVRSAASLRASRADLAHARDEEVLKQGYLHRRDDGLLGTLTRVAGLAPKRRWHRLHGGALYYFDVTSKDKKLLDLDGCSVVRGADRVDNFGGAFAFAVIAEDGSRLCLQAENEDERLRWVSALRRATGAHQTDFLSIGAFQAENPLCAECASDDADWVSTSVGVALCADCAAAHRRLGGEFGRLRALSLDAWSPLVLDYLLLSAGNERARAVWEAVTPPTGWSRPAPDAPAHVKEQWVVAKYAWRGFLAENVFEADPSVALKQAATSGSLQDVVAARARGGDANWRDEGLGDDGRTALHAAAAAGRADVVAFLLLNGAALDDEVHSLAAVTANGVEISRILLEVEQGELW